MSAILHVVIPEHIREILTRTDITNYSLRIIEKLEPEELLEVHKFIELAGGKWLDRYGIYSFQGNPREIMRLPLF